MVTTIPNLTLAGMELEALLEDNLDIQRSILLARSYYHGDQEVFLNDRAREFLGLHPDNTFKLNICRTIVGSLSQEITLLGFDTTERANEDGKKDLSEWARGVFEKNKLDSLQDTVHEAAIGDRESFVIVEWDPIELRPRFVHNPRFISTDAGGDGFGVFMLYENDDITQRPIAAVKQWIDTRFEDSLAVSVLRRTVYYPDRIERWIFDGGAWRPFFQDGVEWPIPWVRGEGEEAEPIGIPVFHFINKGERAEHWDAITMQDAVNKTLVDALAAGDLTAFRTFFGFGFYPTVDGKEPKSDGSNVFKMGPAQFNGTMRPSNEASLQVIDGANITPFYDALKDLVLLTAQITETPASRFITTAQIASADTLKEQDRQLKRKANDRRGRFGDPWVGAISMARKLANIFGGADLDEEPIFLPIWEHTETLDALAEKRTALAIPLEQVWREAGYTEEQIAGMKQTSEYRIQLEKALWEGAQSASLQGIPLETYLRRVGLPEEEISTIVKDIENQSGVPATGL